MSIFLENPLQTLDEIQIEREKRKVKCNYYEYIRYTHGPMYKYTKHGKFVGDILNDAVNKRKAMLSGEILLVTQYLMFSMPPQHGKSMHITETFPSFFLGQFPSEGTIEVSYNDTFAQKFGARNKDKIAGHGEELFGIRISKDTNAKGEWEIINSTTGKKTRGGMISRGIMSGITGSSLGDCIIIDDPIKNREEADSEVYRDKVWSEWQDSISTRIHPGAIVILIMTRWHEDDLAGRLMNPEYGTPYNWQVYNLPLEAGENDPLKRQPGEPLWPDRYGYDFIEERKRYPSSYNALFQGRPSSQEGNMIKRQWWKYYDVLPTLTRKLMSVDAAFKDEDDNDYVCIQVWGKVGPDMYLIDNMKARMNFPTTLQAIRNMVNKHPDAHTKLVEDKANGSAIIQMLQREIGGIIPINPEGGKVARVNAVSPYIESGNVFLPRQAEWVHDFVEECATFPKGKNDDQVDAMSQALNRFIYFYAKQPETDEDANLTPEQRWMKEMDKRHLRETKKNNRRMGR